LNPELLGSLSLKAEGEKGEESLQLKASMSREAGSALLTYTLAFALLLRKSTENLSQGSRVATGILVAPTWLSFEGQPLLAC
jgi:hypothetical protein